MTSNPADAARTGGLYFALVVKWECSPRAGRRRAQCLGTAGPNLPEHHGRGHSNRITQAEATIDEIVWRWCAAT